MKVTRNDIQTIFDKLINEKLTRDEAENLAVEYMKTSDLRVLDFESYELEKMLWDAITYLSGIGTMTAPDVYLHSIEDIKADYEEKWKNL